MIQETVAIKYYLGNPFRFGLIGNHLAHPLGVLDLTLDLFLLASIWMQGGDGNQGHTVVIIDQLGIDVSTGPKNAKPWSLRTS